VEEIHIASRIYNDAPAHQPDLTTASQKSDGRAAEGLLASDHMAPAMKG